jgi:hypothetical protein
MNLLFGVAILVAPFLFAATERAQAVTKDGSQQIEGKGRWPATSLPAR